MVFWLRESVSHRRRNGKGRVGSWPSNFERAGAMPPQLLRRKFCTFFEIIHFKIRLVGFIFKVKWPKSEEKLEFGGR